MSAVAEQVPKVGIVVSAVLAFTALLPWLSVDFLMSMSVSGVRSTEGKLVLLLGVVGLALAALWLTRQHLGFLLGTAATGVLAIIVLIVFASRVGSLFDDALPAGFGDELVRNAVSLDYGWYLAMLAAIALVGVAGYGWWVRRKG
ncbi:hypothetical protein ACIBH1_08580 [Nonomuraea sp. NPDC050663]|uniref:hypothetical protein n=1 Tax=Nonomuraea sp. NPDC050663 TaxID=3364370 RepID=UPI00379C81D0